MDKKRTSFNDTYISSRYKAFNPDGVFVEVVALTNDTKKRYERMGWTFKRTTMREGDRLGSRHQ